MDIRNNSSAAFVKDQLFSRIEYAFNGVDCFLYCICWKIRFSIQITDVFGLKQNDIQLRVFASRYIGRVKPSILSSIRYIFHNIRNFCLEVSGYG